MGSTKNLAETGEVSETGRHVTLPLDCSKCGSPFCCLHEMEDRMTSYVKAWILLIAGNVFVGVVAGAFSLHSWALYNGKVGIGIDINWLLTTCVVSLAGVILWAFPKGKK